MIKLDGSYLEGGGQILRTALALSAVTQKPITVENIRSGRLKPGLKAQHILGIKALQNISKANVTGLRPNASSIKFEPGKLSGGNFRMNVGTAGSITLVLQTILPVIPFLPNDVNFRIIGGTNVKWSPPTEFLERVLLPTLAKMNVKASSKTPKRGYYPKGGGMVVFKAKPSKNLKSIDLTNFGEILNVKGSSHSAALSDSVARDQALSAKSTLQNAGIEDIAITSKAVEKELTLSRGASITLWAKTTTGGLLSSSAVIEKDERAVETGKQAARQLLEYLKPKMPVGPHLADQLIPFMGLAKGKSTINIAKITKHTLTNVWVAEQLLDLHYYVRGKEGEPGTVSVHGLGLKNDSL
ncbi:MAG: RNA 3'-terminal phosphate cyclase [Candidatus Diapherotrites archaeon]|nr:RNA 3'-terminal phosphate cyclase [Candidatus Diapherotrites archaeon]